MLVFFIWFNETCQYNDRWWTTTMTAYGWLGWFDGTEQYRALRQRERWTMIMLIGHHPSLDINRVCARDLVITDDYDGWVSYFIADEESTNNQIKMYYKTSHIFTRYVIIYLIPQLRRRPALLLGIIMATNHIEMVNGYVSIGNEELY